MHGTRLAIPADAEALLSLAKRFATSFRIDDQAFRDTLASVLAADGDHLLVAERDGRLVGYLLGFTRHAFWANGRIGCVEELMVDEEYRHQGIGRMLMGAFEERARQVDARVVALATRRAGTFYESLGYTDSAHYFKKALS